MLPWAGKGVQSFGGSGVSQHLSYGLAGLVQWCWAGVRQQTGICQTPELWGVTEQHKARKKCVSQSWARANPLMHPWLYNWSFTKLRICSLKSGCELHPQKCSKINLPMMGSCPLAGVSTWAVLALLCSISCVQSIELCAANKSAGWWRAGANTKGCGHQSWILTCLNVCETLFLIMFPVLVKI